MPRAPRLVAHTRPVPRRPLPPVRRRAAAVPPPAPPPVPRRHGWLRPLRWAIILAVWGGLAVGALLLWFARDPPRPEAALDAFRRPSLTLEDRAGQVFATFGDVVGEPLRLADLPPWLPQAAVSVEDHRFWQHPGIDPIGLGVPRADLMAGHLAQGGSTITQQVAKNLFLTNARTFQAQGAGTAADALAGAPVQQARDPGDLAEPRLPRAGAWGMDAAAQTLSASRRGT